MRDFAVHQRAEGLGRAAPRINTELGESLSTLSVLIALSMAVLSWAMTGAGVPDFIRIPAQSSLTSVG